mmetsp:Transcript_23438/g.26004  ORF Transcript_23438/g.26004 Transcript_23438/m.26004 type:complete len:83 (-) Transcript_23438:578-826(-)
MDERNYRMLSDEPARLGLGQRKKKSVGPGDSAKSCHSGCVQYAKVKDSCSNVGAFPSGSRQPDCRIQHLGGPKCCHREALGT